MQDRIGTSSDDCLTFGGGDGLRDSGSGVDTHMAGSGKDGSLGGDGNDWLNGGRSDDAQDDDLHGGSGNDLIIARTGKDTDEMSVNVAGFDLMPPAWLYPDDQGASGGIPFRRSA